MEAEPENGAGNHDDQAPILGDVIGNTAYSERFVLKILLKLANRDTLKKELEEPTFEEELCTLWDMAAERDVVLYLQSHDTLNLFCFALTETESSRIIEVIIGIIANMCCHKEAVNSLMADQCLLLLLLEFIKSDDSQILIQLLRLISSCLYVADESDICNWMEVFDKVEYPHSVYFILMNSLNKELLMTALENLNTICMNCKIDGPQQFKFPSLFMTHGAIASVCSAHREYSGQTSPEDKLDRLHLITIQIMLNLDETNIAAEETMNAIDLLRDILISYESKINEFFTIDEDFLHVLNAAKVFAQCMVTSQACSPNHVFYPSHRMWKALISIGEQKNNERTQFMDAIKDSLCLIMCIYMAKCVNVHLVTLFDDIGKVYKDIIIQIRDEKLQMIIHNRFLKYRQKINVDL